MKEVICDACGGEFWQEGDETTCQPCKEMPEPKAPPKAEAKKTR